MSKKIALLLAACLAVALGAGLVACSGGAAKTNIVTNGPDSISALAEEVNDADADGVFTVGFDQEFPPYGYVNDKGDFAGIDLSLAAEVCARNGWELNCVPINWDAKDNELNSGAIDCIWNGFTMEQREDGYTWTKPYMNNTQVVVVKKDAGINSLADLKDKVVLTQVDSAALNLLSEGGDQEALGKTFKELRQSPDYNNAFMELEQGAVDAVAIDEPVAVFQTAGKEDTYTILAEKLNTEHFGVGFAKGNTALRDAVQATLLEMVADGTAQKIVEQYADEGGSWDNWCLTE